MIQQDSHPLFSLMNHPNASKFFLFLLSDAPSIPSQYFHPWEEKLLAPAMMTNEAGELVSTSKKNNETRKSELRQFLKEDILKAVEQHAGDLVMTKTGGKILVEVLKNWDSCAASILTGIESNGLEIFDHPIGFRSVKNLLLSKHPGGLPAAFWGKYSDRISEGLLNSSRGAFVVTALVESSSDAAANLKKDKALKKLLKQKIKNEKFVKGYEVLSGKLT